MPSKVADWIAESPPTATAPPVACTRWPVRAADQQQLGERGPSGGVGPDGLVFRGEVGNPIQPSTWWRVWQKVRARVLTPGQLATPLMRRPYDLRHSGVTWRLNSGVPPTEVAAWAGHSVEVLMRVYARCMTGMEDVWITRMDHALRLQKLKKEQDSG